MSDTESHDQGLSHKEWGAPWGSPGGAIKRWIRQYRADGTGSNSNSESEQY